MRRLKARPFFVLWALWTILMLSAFALDASATPSGYVAKTCNQKQTEHYGSKAVRFMTLHKWGEATWALAATWDSQATCTSYERRPDFVYWWNVEMALAFAKLGNFENSLHYLSQADSWKPPAAAVGKTPEQRAAFAWSAATAESVRGYIATAASSPRRAISSPYGISPAPSNCDNDSVETVSDDGETLTTLYGKTYTFSDYNAVDVNLWLSADDLIICGTTTEGVFLIIDKDEQDERA